MTISSGQLAVDWQDVSQLSLMNSSGECRAGLYLYHCILYRAPCDVVCIEVISGDADLICTCHQ